MPGRRIAGSQRSFSHHLRVFIGDTLDCIVLVYKRNYQDFIVLWVPKKIIFFMQ